MTLMSVDGAAHVEGDDIAARSVARASSAPAMTPAAGPESSVWLG